MTPVKKNYENVVTQIIKNMSIRQIEGYYCPDKESALKKALELIPEGASVGWGGSVTISEIGLTDALKNGSYAVIDRADAKTPEEVREKYLQMFGADWFLMSANAFTLKGELVNIDGNANRVAALCYGPKNVLVVVGMNKLVTDAESGFERARLCAAPPNAVRLGKKTPCGTIGKCGECFTAGECMCSQFVYTRRSSIPNRIKVIIVGETLGF
mgnify:CR=1 FL=1